VFTGDDLTKVTKTKPKASELALTLTLALP
jgi:hypothetical protein